MGINWEVLAGLPGGIIPTLLGSCRACLDRTEDQSFHGGSQFSLNWWVRAGLAVSLTIWFHSSWKVPRHSGCSRVSIPGFVVTEWTGTGGGAEDVGEGAL